MNELRGEESVERLVKTYQPRLKAFIRKRVPNREDAEDLLQDVFYQLIKAAENTASPIEQVAAWLYRVARNLIINSGRKLREEAFPLAGYDGEDDGLKDFSEILFSDDPPTPETEYLRSQVWQEFESALAGLPVEQREAFELTELDGLPAKDVAESLGIPVNTLLSRKHYAVKYLRKRLRGLYGEILQA